jgi:hypothetical protein
MKLRSCFTIAGATAGPLSPLGNKSRFCSARAYLGLCTVLFIAPLASIASAQSGSENYGIVPTLLGQGNAAVNGSQLRKNNSCAPTAVANGLSFLEAYQLSIGKPDPFTISPNSYTNAVNPLQTGMATGDSGTPMNTLWSGLVNYLTVTNPAPSVSLAGQDDKATLNALVWGTQAGAVNAIPDATYLANALNAHDGVELTIEWGSYSGNVFTASGGGHEVTLDSINAGAGTIGFVDPWGPAVGANAGSSGLDMTATWSLTNGYIYITYPISITGGPQDNNTDGTTLVGANGETGRIIADTVEIVPEPGTALFGLAVAAVCLSARRRTRAAA